VPDPSARYRKPPQLPVVAAIATPRPFPAESYDHTREGRIGTSWTLAPTAREHVPELPRPGCQHVRYGYRVTEVGREGAAA